MTFYIILIIACLSFISGVLLLLRGYQFEESQTQAVPISNISEIKSLHTSEEPAKETSQSIETVRKKVFEQQPLEKVSTDHVSHEKNKQTSHVADQELLEMTQMKINHLTNENEQLRDALEREVSSKKMNVLSEEEKKLLEEKERQLIEAKSSIEKLTAETHQLKLENGDVLKELKKSEERGKDFQNKLILIKQTNEEQLMKANDAINALRDQQEQFNAQDMDAVKTQLADSKKALEVMRNQYQDVVNEKNKYISDLQKLNDYNLQLSEKEKSLQYALTKSRAQALGLEKICEDFKDEINQMNQSVV